ncbi:hypothetical protein PS870_06373 [Pseudomonas fluorescens]|uniref:FAD-binding PCMH-type domain-containing protein n=1 Tax=Pseudomonas fluorescens TaxID=294 RepID=A0A5E7QID7_PSEFL|nr:FAD-binding oxidoreductase [Pseudomonas fluorescens]VVP61564.1 hypothetical protein PS870_06373 [Pseudomonas fluorescens]
MVGLSGRAEFRQQLHGEVVFHDDESYEYRRCGASWNGRNPRRYPDVLVFADCADDVIATVQYARKNGKHISCKTGGHSHSVCFLQANCILLDFSRLNALHVNIKHKTVYVEAGVTSRQLDETLATYALAFPTGHDGAVTMAGFLLGGGLGINCAAWGGMSTFNIEAVDVILPSGERCHASLSQCTDVYWAVRGGASGVFFAVIGFYLRCYDRPACITTNNYFFRLSELPAIVRIVSDISDSIEPSLQVMLSMPIAPKALQSKGAVEESERLAVISAVAFSGSKEEARRLHAPLERHLTRSNALHIEKELATTFDDFYTQSEKMAVCARWCADNILTDEIIPVSELLAKHVLLSPSLKSLPLIIWQGNRSWPDAAYSGRGSYFVSTYVQWDGDENDKEHSDWLYQCYSELEPFARGHYINELDRERRPENIPSCYSVAHWEKLCLLKEQYDPDRVFLGFQLI